MATKTEVPIFRVTQAPGFATGLKMYTPGEEIPWEKPDGWDDVKYGKHFSEYGPSLSFECVNDAAKKLMADHQEVVRKKNIPKPTVDDERFSKMEALNLQMMQAQLETQALLRRMLENQTEADEAKSKKKS